MGRLRAIAEQKQALDLHPKITDFLLNLHHG